MSYYAESVVRFQQHLTAKHSVVRLGILHKPARVRKRMQRPGDTRVQLIKTQLSQWLIEPLAINNPGAVIQ